MKKTRRFRVEDLSNALSECAAEIAVSWNDADGMRIELLRRRQIALAALSRPNPKGGAHTPESRRKSREKSKLSGYDCWNAMIGRCHRPKRKDYSKYGAVGITVCDRWRFGVFGKTGFQCFIEDIGKRPSLNHTIDRIDGSKIYGPETCKWSDWFEQGSNRSNNVKITAMGKTQTASEWSRETGVPACMIINRIKKGGWSAEDAILGLGADQKKAPRDAL